LLSPPLFSLLLSLSPSPPLSPRPLSSLLLSSLSSSLSFSSSLSSPPPLPSNESQCQYLWYEIHFRRVISRIFWTQICIPNLLNVKSNYDLLMDLTFIVDDMTAFRVSGKNKTLDRVWIPS